MDKISNTSHTVFGVGSFSEGPAGPARDETLVRLLAAATATIDSDRDRAKACVQQATDLLRVSLEQEGHPWNEPASRGGLAVWQAKRVVAYIEANISRSLRVADDPVFPSDRLPKPSSPPAGMEPPR